MEFPSLRPSRFLKKPEKKDNFFYKSSEIRAWIFSGVLAIAGLGYVGDTLIKKSDQATEHYTRIVTGILEGRNSSHTHIGKLPIGEIENYILAFEKNILEVTL